MLQIPRSLRPQSGTKVLGIGRGSGTALSDLFKMGAGSAQAVDIRARTDATSGNDARVLYARMHHYGAGGGEAIRAYSFANTTNVATGGTLNGLHASVSIATSSSISGAANAGRFTLEAAAASRTLGGALSAIQVDSNVGTGNTMPTIHGFLRFTNTGAVALSNLMVLPAAPANGSIFAAHVTDGMTHSIRVIDSAGTAYYVMATTTVTNRS